MKITKTIAFPAAALLTMVASATFTHAASITGFVVEGGGTQQVHQLNNGNFLGLWGFDNRENANPGAGAVTINSSADIVGGFTSGGASIVNFYNGTNPINSGASEFDELTFSFTLADNTRLFDSVWVEWTGGNLVYSNPAGGTTTMNSTNITRPGDPIPEPTSLALLAIGGLIATRRRRR
ncbi:MAG: PEP-CTERM sorting domain-containing protein [Planctomycetota bacterium]